MKNLMNHLSAKDSDEIRLLAAQRRKEYREGTRKRPEESKKYYKPRACILNLPEGYDNEILVGLLLLKNLSVKQLADNTQLSYAELVKMIYHHISFNKDYMRQISLFFGYPEEILFAEKQTTIRDRIFNLINSNRIENTSLLTLNQKMISDITDLQVYQIEYGLDIIKNEGKIDWMQDKNGKYYILFLDMP